VSTAPERRARLSLGRSTPRTLYLIKGLELALRPHLEAIANEFGITTLQYTALSVLVDHPGMTAAQLGRRSFVSTQAANEMIGLLESKGLVEREPSSSDRRKLDIHLTDKGLAALRACDRGVERFEALVLADLDDEERQGFREMLQRCYASLRDVPADPT
jgi:DNA-binding MarR family transcriptional regulator